VASDFAIRLVSDWPGCDEIIFIAEPKTVFHLPAIKTGFDNLPSFPVGVISYNDMLAENTKEPGLKISQILLAIRSYRFVRAK
jgi:hypothetical protein